MEYANDYKIDDDPELGRNDAVGNDTIDGDKVGDSETFDFEFGAYDAAENGDVKREFGDSETLESGYGSDVAAENKDVDREFVDKSDFQLIQPVKSFMILLLSFESLMIQSLGKMMQLVMMLLMNMELTKLKIMMQKVMEVFRDI